MEDLPKIRMEFAQEYFEKSADYNRDLQRWVGELYLELHRGTLTTQALIKKMNRKLEFLLRQVEMLYAIYAPEHYPLDILNECWEDLLLNQFHDIIPGTSIQRVNLECLDQYNAIESKLTMLLQKGLEYKGQHKLVPGGEGVMIIENDLGWDRSDVYQTSLSADFFDVEGQPLPSQQTADGMTAVRIDAIPSIGFKEIRFKEKPFAEIPGIVASLYLANPILCAGVR